MKFKWPFMPKALKPKFHEKELRNRMELLEKSLRKKHGSKRLISKAKEAGDLDEAAAEELQAYIDWRNSGDLAI